MNELTFLFLYLQKDDFEYLLHNESQDDNHSLCMTNKKARH